MKYNKKWGKKAFWSKKKKNHKSHMYLIVTGETPVQPSSFPYVRERERIWRLRLLQRRKLRKGKMNKNCICVRLSNWCWWLSLWKPHIFIIQDSKQSLSLTHPFEYCRHLIKIQKPLQINWKYKSNSWCDILWPANTNLFFLFYFMFHHSR